jgi:hypothetical protein
LADVGEAVWIAAEVIERVMGDLRTQSVDVVRGLVHFVRSRYRE